MAQGTTKGVPIDVDGTLATNSDVLVASQKATKTYVDGRTATDLGLGNVDNTSDLAKPISTATQTALDLKQPDIQFEDEGLVLGTAGTVDTVDFTGAGVTASRVGDKVTVTIPGGGGGGGGTGDVVGPASATDNAIARFDTTTGKLIQNSVVTIADTSGNMAGVGTLNTHTIPGGTGTIALTTDITPAPVDSVNGQTGVVVLDKTDVGLGNVDNTSDLNKPVSTATQTALDTKGNVSNSGTPVATQLAIFNSATTVEGITGLTYSGTALSAPGSFVLATAIRLISSGDINYYQNGDGTGGSWRECRFAKYSSGDWYMRLDATGKLQMGNGSGAALGTAINEFSIDGTLAGNSDDAVPTEKAVKTYVDDSITVTPTSTTTFTNKTIDVDNNTVTNVEVDNFKASAIVTESEGIDSNDNDTTIPTSAAVKDYVDNNSGGGGGGSYKRAIAGTIGATGTNVAHTILVNSSVTFTSCNLWYGTAGSGTLTVDINKNGTTLYSTTKPSITTTNQTSVGTGTLTTTTAVQGDLLTIDIDAVPGTKGVDLYVELFYS